MPTLPHESPTDGITEDDDSGPTRRCILTGVRCAPDDLIRLIQAPDGAVVADLAYKLPGRGAWVTPRRPLVEAAVRTGKLKGMLARSWRTDAAKISGLDALIGLIDTGLLRRVHDRLGLEKRASNIILGFDAIRDGLIKGKVVALLHASDAAADGRSKLSGKCEAEDLPCALSRDEMSLALGRDNVVHAGVTDPGAASRLAGALRLIMLWRQPEGGATLETVRN